MEFTGYKQTYRNYLPIGHYDLIIISLVHQGPEMVYYMVENIKKYVKGSFLWVVHYNNEQKIDENTLPPWAWIVRDTIKTERHTRLLLMALNQTLKFALNNTRSINIMTLSSGSAFFREFIVPTKKKVSLILHENIIALPGKNYGHSEEIDICHLGNCTQYLESIGAGGWHYKFGADSDFEFNDMVTKRGFKYLRGTQWSGQIWPYEVGCMLKDDLSELETSNLRLGYACEELYMSTYAHNYAKDNDISIDLVQVIIDWGNKYEIEDINYINNLRDTCTMEGSAVCKLPDNINSDVRKYLILPD